MAGFRETLSEYIAEDLAESGLDGDFGDNPSPDVYQLKFVAWQKGFRVDKIPKKELVAEEIRRRDARASISADIFAARVFRNSEGL